MRCRRNLIKLCPIKTFVLKELKLWVFVAVNLILKRDINY